jgi:uncharacterized BrkB/YihY/UPF0761 family membrane protein
MSRWERLKELWRIAHLVFLRQDAAAVRTHSASVAYRSIIAAISFTAVTYFLADRSGLSWVGSQVDVPPDLEAVAELQAERISELNDGTVAFVGLIGLTIGAWGLASGFAALYDALNRIHGTHQYRTWVRRYARALLVAAIFSVLMFIAFVLLSASTSLGRGLFEAIGLERVGALVALALTLASMVVFAPIAFTLLLRYGSEARPTWTECATAGAITGIGWVLMTLALLGFGQLVGIYRGYGASALSLTVMLYAYWTCYLLFTSVLFARAVADEVVRLHARRVQAREAAADGTSNDEPPADPAP